MGNRYLLVMWEGGGVAPPELGLARRLIARGHEVRVLGDPTLEPEARAAGCEFAPWTTAPHVTERGPDGALIRDWEQRNVLKFMSTYLDAFLARPAPQWAADVDSELERGAFDGMLADFALPATTIPAEARGIPFLSIMPNCWIIPTRGIPPIGPGFMPSTNPAARARDAAMRAVITRVFNRALPHLNATRAAYGLAPVGSTYEQMIGRRMLLLTTPALDFTSPYLPDAVRYVGPILDDPSWTEPWVSPWPDDDRRPLVLVGMSSTYQDQAEVLNRVADALAGLPVRALVTLGPSLTTDAVPSRRGAGDVQVVTSAPHAVVLREASVVVTHAGHGTVVKALAAGVPVVAIPMGRDQNDTAARVVARGAGVRLKVTAPIGAIRSAVDRVLEQPSYREAAGRLARAIADGDGCVDPVAEVEALVGGGVTTT